MAAGGSYQRGYGPATGPGGERAPKAVRDYFSGLLAAAAGIVTGPGRAMRGEMPVFDPETGHASPEAIGWGGDTAMALAGGGTGFAEKDAAGIFGGKLPKGMTREEALRLEEEAAARGAGSEAPISGLPEKTAPLDETYFKPSPNAKARQAAREYMAERGGYRLPERYEPADPERGHDIAVEFENMKHDPSNPAVAKSYDALARETLAQWQAMKKTGLKVEFIPPGAPDPYAKSPRLAQEDIRDNNHLWVFPTESGFGTGPEAAAARAENPMLRDSGETIGGQPAVINDIFRAVHDYFGHTKEGVGFRASGEDNAWRSHAAMYSDEALPAMTSETRGQNSWVNFGPHAEENVHASGAKTTYAPQKIGIMPEWTWRGRDYHAGLKEAAK